MATNTAIKTRIGFVGLGNMGGNMAARFLAAGYPVYGEERSRPHAERLVHEGLQWRDTPKAHRASAMAKTNPSPVHRSVHRLVARE